ncbi:endonuclease YncB(thermonuclease family) [Geothermobacter ehrlichii]|uniref:Endonuclease YncB(Thermonuclease family) n=1 Tax=Geothermobacter ehrlichii TaxID=213224 RepID=A0A5D3WJK0_9BACT|nr:thermonuclease family protein [Geothermobacter ehrlichii]TYO96764.1 endonuclease YncB(thermonuclease family) [Geothermobacter ehrlichii]
MKYFCMTLCLFFFLFTDTAVYSMDLCRASNVIDGDSLTIKCQRYNGIIGLYGVDAPELTQAYGNEAKNYLFNLVKNKQLIIISMFHKQKKASIVFENGKSLNAQLILNGYAWADKNERSPSSRYLKFEKEARKSKKGLWAIENNVQPWVYRLRYNLADDEEKVLNNLETSKFNQEQKKHGHSSQSNKYSNYSECFYAEYSKAVGGSSAKTASGAIINLKIGTSVAQTICDAMFGVKRKTTKRKISKAIKCRSDYTCRIGYMCMKKPYRSEGICVKRVDKYGIQSFDPPQADSVGPRLDEGCISSVDCPTGFRCDPFYKQCVK